MPDRVADAVIAFLALLIVTSVSMIFGELVPKNLAVARPLATARAVAGAAAAVLLADDTGRSG